MKCPECGLETEGFPCQECGYDPEDEDIEDYD